MGAPRHAWVACFIAGALVAACTSLSPPPPPSDEQDLRSHLRVSAAVTDTTLAAAGAIADDFERGVRRVIVRVVEGMDLEVHFEVDRPMSLPWPPFLCLVGPFWAPDDAGLSDRCWGEPDLGARAAASGPDADGTGPIRLEPGRPLIMRAALERGAMRCDYPPGSWTLEIAFSPPGTRPGPDRLALEDVVVEVPVDDAQPLLLLHPTESRYCGLANVVVREQGEPEVIVSAAPRA
jgi:hypothetical protein